MSSVRKMMWSGVWLSVLAAMVLLVGQPAAAQQPPADGPAAQAAPDKSESEMKEPEFRGRLPAYFAAVVTDKQRQEVYKIQAEYHKKISALMKEVEKLTAERNKKVDGVLTPEQLAEVNKKRQEAAARRQARRSSSQSTSSERN